MNDDRHDDPPTVDSLADLQAGLLDDETAAQLRERIRTDPGARQTMEALNRVRRDVAALGSDSRLRHRSTPRLSTISRPPCTPPIRYSAGGSGAPGADSGGGGGPGRDRPRGLAGNPGAAHAAVAPAEPAHHHRTHHGVAPAADDSAVGSADPRPAGPRTGPRPADRSTSPCLMPGRSGLPGDTRSARRPPDRHRRPAGRSAGATRRRARRVFAALAVAPTCSSVNTGLLADRTVHRP